MAYGVSVDARSVPNTGYDSSSRAAAAVSACWTAICSLGIIVGRCLRNGRVRQGGRIGRDGIGEGMQARGWRVVILVSALGSMGATHRSRNFVVHAPDASIAKQVAAAAEHYRDELALEWTGETMKPWSSPCVVNVKVGQYGAGGATSFQFDRGHVFGWRMSVQGSLERILDSVLPHEVSHTVFACYFRRPLPRWADEGAATLAENESEKLRQRKTARQVLRTSRRIPMRQLLAIKEYPPDMQQVLTLYAQGYSLADYLIQQKGKPTYLSFLNDAHRHGWDHALKKHYARKNVEELEQQWGEWVVAGSPTLQLPEGQMLAQNEPPPRQKRDAVVVRAQNPKSGVPAVGAVVALATAKLSRDRLQAALGRVSHSTLMKTDDVSAPDPRGLGRRFPHPIPPPQERLASAASTPKAAPNSVHASSANLRTRESLPPKTPRALPRPNSRPLKRLSPPKPIAQPTPPPSASSPPASPARPKSTPPAPDWRKRYRWPTTPPNDVYLGKPSSVPFQF